MEAGGEIAILEAQKLAAVQIEDYDRAAQLKRRIDELKQVRSSLSRSPPFSCSCCCSCCCCAVVYRGMETTNGS